ncbi:glycosyltransferase family 8 protein [Riemerella anatipestifer]|nr:glycosyltransferase family 8 protein [Riemerella anatipestifer]MDY3350454.1 glycosyltransferase family 8 protein [Riemerella anatipestifer]
MFLPIVLTCDDKYFKYANVVITSILENKNKNCFYEFNILSEFISEPNKEKMTKQLERYSNASCRFIELENINSEKFHLNSYMNASTYYRFYIPKIFKDYERILYLDSDLIVDYDISSFATIDFENKLAICCYSPYIRNIVKNGGNDLFPISYFTNILKMSTPQEYFNAGVMLYNMKKITTEKLESKFFEAIEQIKTPKLQDQDILNSVLSNNGGVKFVDQRFNNTRCIKITKKRILYNRLLHKIGVKDKNKLFFIYHYVGKDKPWNSPRKEDSILFEYYAKKSPFYKEILLEDKKNSNL